MCIVSEKSEAVRAFILKELHSGASVYKCYGVRDLVEKDEIITIVSKTEYQKLMAYMQKEDPEAFITVYKVSDMRYVPKGADYGDDAKL